LTKADFDQLSRGSLNLRELELIAKLFIKRCPSGFSPLFVTCLAAALLLWARAPDAFAHPQFFAEDLGIFWLQWRDLGIASFFTPYGGYLHLAPRLGAASTALLPFYLQPAAYLATAVVATVWTVVTVASAQLPRGLGLALAASILVVPHDGEVWASLVNMQWIMACALPVIAATGAPRATGARINQFAFLGIASLTGPFSAILVPLWIARGISALKAREGYGLAIAALGMLAGLTQVVCVASSDAPHEVPGQARPLAMALAFVQRFGLDYLSACSSALGVALMLSLLLSPAVREGRLLRVSFLASAILLMIPTFIKFYRMPELMIARSVAGRYFYIPSVMLLWTAISLAWVRRPWPVAIGAMSSLLIVAAAIEHFKRTPRPFYPDWQQKSDLIGRQAVIIQYAPGWLITISPVSP
jgi:hypothetical protein